MLTFVSECIVGSKYVFISYGEIYNSSTRTFIASSHLVEDLVQHGVGRLVARQALLGEVLVRLGQALDLETTGDEVRLG